MLNKNLKKQSKYTKPTMELNCCDKLVRDEVKVLNQKNSKLPAYAFTLEQANEITRRCKFKVKVENDGEIYIITKIGGIKR